MYHLERFHIVMIVNFCIVDVVSRLVPDIVFFASVTFTRITVEFLFTYNKS